MNRWFSFRFSSASERISLSEIVKVQPLCDAKSHAEVNGECLAHFVEGGAGAEETETDAVLSIRRHWVGRIDSFVFVVENQSCRKAKSRSLAASVVEELVDESYSDTNHRAQGVVGLVDDANSR